MTEGRFMDVSPEVSMATVLAKTMRKNGTKTYGLSPALY